MDGGIDILKGVLKFALILSAMPAVVLALSLVYLFIEKIAV